MRFAEKIVVFVLRPIYRTFFERLIWWYLTKIKAFFLAETGPQIAEIRAQVSECLRRLDSIESGYQQRLAGIEERLRSAEANNAAQWDGLEQLLLAMFRRPESRVSDPEPAVSTPGEISIESVTDLNRVHAASSIR